MDAGGARGARHGDAGVLRRAGRRVPAPAKASLLRTLRAYGRATQSMRGLPDFILIGGKRCGTTTLYWLLLRHPFVAPLFPSAKRIKGIHFFDWNYHRGVAWYRSHFPTDLHRAVTRIRGGRPPIAGEASTSYLFHPLAPARAAEVAPEARLIVLLRDPVERAWSHHSNRARLGLEPLSFEDAIRAEPERLAGERERLVADPRYRSHAWEQQAYLTLGRYVDPLREWTERFGSPRVLALFTEDLARDPAGTFRRVVEFLGLPPWTPPGVEPMNVGAGAGEMRPETRSRLVEGYAADNALLAEHLGIDPGWPRPGGA